MSSASQFPSETSSEVYEHYTAPNAALTKAIAKFNHAVGYPFNIFMSWPSLYAAYSSTFPLKTTFIPTVSSFIITMLDALVNYLEDTDEEGGFQEQWLRICEMHPTVYQAGLLVRARNVGRPKCYFARVGTINVYRWILDLPVAWDKRCFEQWAGRAIWELESEPDLEIGPGMGLIAVDESSYSRTMTSTPRLRKVGTDEWSLIGDVPGGIIRSTEDLDHHSSQHHYAALPQLSSIPPPGQLFNSANMASYNHLLIMHANSASIEIQCTHQPTLELIRDYFAKHTRINQNKTNLPPFVKIELLKSMWGAPNTSDQNSLPAEAGSSHESPASSGATAMTEPIEMLRFHCREEVNYGGRLDLAYIVGFVEGVCGYRLVNGCTGESGRWIFRRRFQ
ncbi:hypothetical protein BDZ91DRAFT_739009 [Kalaharituber pfeilii]|nr:hypothetical protein BDZ91DRAFT_739009 [Kalaharituber pfeilii]